VYLPFLGILIDNWREAAEDGEMGAASASSLRRLEIELFSALFVVMLAGQPSALTALDAGVLRYTPPPTLTNPDPQSATVNAPRSTYGTAGFTGSPETVNVPVWWYAVLAVSSGINHAVIEGFPTAADLRTYEQQARLATIADPRLRSEVSQFYSDCFVPARSRYLAGEPRTDAIAAIVDEYGDDDTDWLGSHVYRRLAGYYDRYRASVPIPGWSFSAARDTEYDAAAPPEWGKPVCDEWWAANDIGLRQRLVDEADATSAGLSGLIVAIAPALASERQHDAVARTVLANAPESWSSNDLTAYNAGTSGMLSYVEQVVKGGLAAGGIVATSAVFSVTMTVILEGLPIIQAVLLLGIYALLPMLIVLSRYSISMLATGALAIFTVKFWSVLWYLALWVDQNLILSMYPDINIFLQLFANPGEHDVKRMLLNMITTSLYLGLPLLWSATMGWAGIHVGRSLSTAASPLARPSENAGRQGAQTGKAAIGAAARK